MPTCSVMLYDRRIGSVVRIWVDFTFRSRQSICELALQEIGQSVPHDDVDESARKRLG
jgi:hypothetical protein